MKRRELITFNGDLPKFIDNLVERAIQDVKPFFGGSLLGLGDYRNPLVTWKDEEDKYVGRAEVPGASKENLKLIVDSNARTLKVESKDVKEEESEDSYSRSESNYRYFTMLPDDVDYNNITSKHENGVLEIIIGRKAEKGKEIPIK